MRRKRVVRLKARVDDGGRLAIDLPTLSAGTAVEVLLLLPRKEELTESEPEPNPSPVRRLLQSAADVELFMEVERAAWEH